MTFDNLSLKSNVAPETINHVVRDCDYVKPLCEHVTPFTIYVVDYASSYLSSLKSRWMILSISTLHFLVNIILPPL